MASLRGLQLYKYLIKMENSLPKMLCEYCYSSFSAKGEAEAQNNENTWTQVHIKLKKMKK